MAQESSKSPQVIGVNIFFTLGPLEFEGQTNVPYIKQKAKNYQNYILNNNLLEHKLIYQSKL